LSFELLKCSKFLSGWGLCPQTPALVAQYSFWKPPFKNPVTKVTKFSDHDTLTEHSMRFSIRTVNTIDCENIYLWRILKIVHSEIEEFWYFRRNGGFIIERLASTGKVAAGERV